MARIGGGLAGPWSGFRREDLQERDEQVELVRSGLAMGTRFEVRLRGAEAEHLEALAVAVLEEIERIERLLSAYDQRSEISRINRAAGAGPVRIDRELFALLAECEAARGETAGAFDIGGGQRFRLDPAAVTVCFDEVAGRLDPGGVGKGYALDRGRAILTRYGVESGLINGGTSSILAVGALEQVAWPIDLRHPDGPDSPAVGSIELIDGALSCSAVSGAERQTAIVDWRTGLPVEGTAACYVLAPEATQAEILSTALLVMGRGRALEYLDRRRLPTVKVGWFDTEVGLIWITGKEAEGRWR